MKLLSRFVIAGALLGLSGCGSLPGSSLGDTWFAEPFLTEKFEGKDFNKSLARAYQAQATQAAKVDVNWYDATAYVKKGYAAAAGGNVAPWKSSDLGLTGHDDMYGKVAAAINANKNVRPQECANLQVGWDNFLEETSEAVKSLNGTTDADKAKAKMPELLKLCASVKDAAIPSAGKSSKFTVYFDFNKTNVTAAAAKILNDVSAAIKSVVKPAISIVGYADTVGSDKYNQVLSEKRANSIAASLSKSGADKKKMTLAGRGERELAVPTKDNVREQKNRRVEITISE